jgi:hypothetical protein
MFGRRNEDRHGRR